MSKTKWILIVLVLVFVAGAGYYTISPLFKNIEIEDALPESVEQTISENIPADEDMVAPITSLGSPVMSTAGHPAEGVVRVLNTENGQIIRYENFKTINGPNLHVYLAKDLAAKDFIDLGKIRGTEGNINYTVPDGVDLSEYRYVMYWCVPFSVLFNYAELKN